MGRISIGNLFSGPDVNGEIHRIALPSNVEVVMAKVLEDQCGNALNSDEFLPGISPVKRVKESFRVGNNQTEGVYRGKYVGKVTENKVRI